MKKLGGKEKGIIKLIVSIFILIIVLFGIKLKIDDPFISGVKGWLSLALLIWSFVSIVRVSGEIAPTKKKEIKTDEEQVVPKIDSILHLGNKSGKNKSHKRIITVKSAAALLAEWDVIEFEALVGDESLIFGSSSDCEAGSSVSFDKFYYIGKLEYTRLDEAVEALNLLFPSGEIPLIHIDGVDPMKYKIPEA